MRVGTSKVGYTYRKLDRLMKCRVQLYVAGKVFYEDVEARDYKEAREVALARNPNAKVMGVTALM